MGTHLLELPVVGTLLGHTMNCRETIRIICDYLEGKLAKPAAAAVQRHIGKCPDCRQVHETAKRTLEAYFDRDLVPQARSSHHAKVA